MSVMYVLPSLLPYESGSGMALGGFYVTFSESVSCVIYLMIWYVVHVKADVIFLHNLKACTLGSEPSRKQELLVISIKEKLQSTNGATLQRSFDSQH